MKSNEQNIDSNDLTPQPTAKCCGKDTNCPNTRSGGKLACYDWLNDIPEAMQESDLVEVQFKNTRKGYYRNTNKLPIECGDMIAVESNPGHDIGVVTLMGKMVQLQMKKNGFRSDISELKRVYRKAKANDLEKYEEAKSREHDTMIRSRKIAQSLNLNMKIGDVEYQGDCNKAIFYYIADERVDFRQLIKVLSENFRVRIEMKQIGARQEAGRIGGIGPCGRQLCCSGWMSNFVSVSTSAARYQDISLNPQKLAGQCAKLKCCINFEVDSYVEAQKRLPSREIKLETKDNLYYHFKTDIFKQELTYSTSRDVLANLVTISADRVFEVIAMNKKGIKPDRLDDNVEKPAAPKEFGDVVGQDSLTRFDKTKRRNNNRGRGRGGNGNGEGKGENERNENRKPRAQQQGGAKGGEGREPNKKVIKLNREPNKEGKPKEEREPRENRGREARPPRAPRPPRPAVEGESTAEGATPRKRRSQPRRNNEGGNGAKNSDRPAPEKSNNNEQKGEA